MSRLARPVVALLALTLAGSATVTAPAAADQTTPGVAPVMIVMDTSGSMEERAGDGSTAKIEDARRAVIDLVDVLDRDQTVGLMNYPAGEPVGGCEGSNVVLPLGQPDPVKTSAAVRKLVAEGGTPTALALRRAGAELKKTGAVRGVIVLVSDGEANCGPPVCEVAKELADQNIDLTVNTVGFDIASDSEVADELACVAKATGGTYIYARDGEELRKALREAAASNLAIDVTVPEQMPVAVGRGSASRTTVSATVTNTGQVEARDVRVTLDFVDFKKAGGALLVLQPIRYLGNLGPGEERTVEFDVRPFESRVNQTFDWFLAASAKGGIGSLRQGKTSTYRRSATDVGPLLQGKGIVAVVGDSYSSGEGSGTYLPEVEKGSKCHRSASAYGAVLFGSKVKNLACSGAVTSDFYQSQWSNDVAQRPQVSQLRSLARSDTSPRAVLLTIGGNDAQFVNVVTACATPGGDCLTNKKYLDQIGQIANDLKDVYRDVNSAVNDDSALERRNGAIAPIVVLPYVRIVPTSGSGRDGCFVGISETELRFLNQFLDRLNGTIAVAVGEARRDGVPIYLADDVVAAMQPDHTICDDDPYAVTRHADFGAGYVQAAWWADQQWLHPNAKGYEAIARSVAAWSHTVSPVDASPAPWFGSSARTRTLNPGFLDLIERAPSSAGVSVASAGSTRPIESEGFAPESQVVVTVASTPRVVGAFRADEDGRISGRVTIPVKTPVGRHTLSFAGVDPDGGPRVVSENLRVVPQHTVLALLSLFAGLVVLAIGLVMRQRRAVSRRTPPGG